jgi:hypothetical protein
MRGVMAHVEAVCLSHKKGNSHKKAKNKIIE